MRGKTNKFLGILLALAMLLTSVLPSMSALAAGTAEVTLVSSAADALKPGDTFTVTPTIANNPGFAGATWKLEYDNTALELTGITADGRKAGHLFGYGTFVSNPTYGKNNLVYANATLETENGALCELTFKVRDDAAAGDYTVNIAKSDADFKFVALNSVNVDVNFTAANVKVAGNQSEYADAYLAYCKGTAGAYEFLPVGETLYINNYAKADGAKELIAEYKIAVVNNGEIVSGMSDDKWAVEGNVFKTAAHTASDPDGVLTVNATGKLEDAAGTLTATLPDGTALSTNVHVTKTPWKIMANGVSGVPYDQYRSQTKTVYAYINESFKFTYALQTATNGSIKGTNVKLSFASSDAKVATVAEDGTITAIGEGTAQISVKAVAYNYGVPTEIQLLNTLNVIVDKGFVTNFVLADADGNVRTENTINKKGQTVPQLTMNAGEEITLNVKAMPGMIDAECAGTIANLKQFTVSTNKTALTATTVDTNTVTLKAADVTADTTVTVKSPQYYRSKASSANLWAEQFTLTVNIKAATAVESVSLNESALSMNTGDTANLTATVTPAEANQNVVWSTSNSEVATVENGVVTAVAAGTATIKATSASDETKFAECEVTVTKVIPVTSISWDFVNANSELKYEESLKVQVNQANVYIVNADDVGKTISLTASYTPSDATNKSLNLVKWALLGDNADQIASVDEYGTVTWKGGYGKVQLSGTFKGTTKTADIFFTTGTAALPKVMKDGAEVTGTTVVKHDQPATFTASWTASNDVFTPEYQWFRQTGKASAVAKAETIGEKNQPLTVTAADLASWGVEDGGTVVLQLRIAKYKGADPVRILPRAVEWKTFKVQYDATVDVTGVTLNETAIELEAGKTQQLTATVTPAEANQNVVWSTSNSEVATVENGVVTAVAAGTATIKATSASDETKFAECEVTVAAKPDYSNAYLAYCKGSKTAYEFIPVGDTLHINNWANGQKSVQEYRIAVVNNGEIVADMPKEKWSVENKANIFMNAYHDSSDLDGVFYINAHGKTDGATGSITATLPDGSTLTTNVVVTETPSDIAVNGVTGIGKSQYNNRTAYANIGEAFKYTYTYKNSSNNKVNAANAKFTFESADPAVATVAEDGTITAKGEGSTTITVYALTYYYGEITPIAMKTALSVTVDQNYIKYFAVADAEGNIQGTYAENAYGYVQPTITLNAGEEITLFAKGMPGKAEPVYSSTAKAFKLHSGSGITVTNNDDGSFTLKADDVTEETTAAVRSPGFYRSAANKKAASSFDTHVVIRPAAAVESVTVNPTAVELKEGETATLTATVNPENANQAIVWTSENEEVATVENGVVTALKAGTVTIKATSAKDDTKFATCEVTVKSNKSITVEANYDSSSASNFPKAYGRDGVDITKVVKVTTEPAGLEYDLKVDLNGVLNNTIRAAMRYDADTHMLSIKNTYGIISNIPVVATLKDDPTVTSTVKISVNFIKVKVDGLTLADENGNTEGTYKVGDTLILKAVYNPANATTQDTRWESKNKDVATVEMLTDPDGESTAKVTIVGEGTAEIGVWPNNNDYSEGYKLRQTYAITVPATPKLEGLTALLGCDQTTVNVGDEIDVKLYVNSDNAEETYNAFKFGVNFSENLEYLGFTGLDTENDYNFVDAAGNTVTVSGFGASKSVSGENALVTLRFKATASGDAKITLPEDAAFANEKNVAVSENLQAIKVMNGEVTVKVVKTFEIPVTGGTVDGGKTVIPATEGESASFTPDQPENGTVIDKVLVDGEEVSPNPDGSYTIPNPTENTTVTIVTRKLTYNVTFTGNGAADANGAKTAAHGEDYEFTITKDADYNYTVTATIAGKDVAVTGEYKISGADVTGDITIVITKTEKSEEETMRSVTAYLNDSAEGKEMAKVAKNAQNYVFSNPYTQTAKAIRATVKGTEVAITANDDGTWTIPGTFAGNVEIYFAGVYSVTKPEAITGEATAEYDKDYTFTVPAAYATSKPTATIGGEAYALSDGTADENGDIVYTISGKDVKGDIVISLPDPTALVEVNLYFKAEDANGEARNVYIVTAKPNLPMPEGKVFAYNGEAMFWSEEYQAYAYLVSTGEALTAETATAQVALTAGAAQTIDYSGDVNMSGKVDLNDAQLVYDLYNATYYDFSTVSMGKMLRADVSKDKKIDVSDVTAIVAIVRK